MTSPARFLANLLNSSGNVPDAKLVALTASKLTGQVPDANAPSGSVIQVVQTVMTGRASITGNSFVDVPNYSVTITPRSATSKIMVEICLHVGESQDAFPVFRLYRNGTELQIASLGGDGTSGMFGKTTTQNSVRDIYLLEPVNFKFLDSPNSTSALTYTVKCRPFGSSTNRIIYFNRAQAMGQDVNQFTVLSTFTATEIAA